ncbi:MAG TPA: PD-(D/E)XK nuclease-like domain-containing protein [Thermoanaerobaculia bacterium]|nr:PD-(D/E)XK nuclease-like domain-containing protein [Thermoanaerobaculia bacterium]
MTVAEVERVQYRPGLYPNLSRAEYEAIPAINASVLEHFERSAAHAREAMLHPPKPTDAMEFGTALHVAVLEPARFSREYVAAPKCDRRTKVGKETWAAFEAEHRGAQLMDAEDFIAICRMRDAVWSHPVAKELLRGPGHNEVAVVWENEETGLLCKALLDRIGSFDGWTWIPDLKSTGDASPREFSYSIKRYHYGAKAAYYLDGCNTVAPRPRRFCWIAIEKEPPYAVALYEPTDDAINAGRSKYMRWLRLYEEAQRTNHWPGYETSIQPLGAESTEWYA